MELLQVNTGVVEYSLNDTVTLRLNPTDPNFVRRLFDRFNELESKDKEWREQLTEIKDPEKLLDLYDEGDRMFREAIDDTLGAGTCEALLGSTSVLALADGAPVWMNILIAVIDKMDAAFVTQQQAQNPRLQKYLKKYSRK